MDRRCVAARPWLLSIDHPGVVAEIGPAAASTVTGPGTATLVYETLTQLHVALDRVYKLGMSLPEAPFLRFRAATAKLPQTTEAERLVVQRVGQRSVPRRPHGLLGRPLSYHWHH